MTPDRRHNQGTYMRRLIALLLLAVPLAGCGDPLEGVGELSRRVVHGDETTTTTTEAVVAPVLDLKGVSDDVQWLNDGLDAGVDGDRETLIRGVWRRGGESSLFVQSSRAEIAAALPDVEFLRLVPSQIIHVSSQLVFDPQTATLDVSTAAAFGLWVTEPYTVPRADGQLAVLRVGLRTLEDTTGGEILTFTTSSGRELAWVDGDYVYQLFCRTGVSEESCIAMAESTARLALLVPALPTTTTTTEG
jgi:hypothetical protein